MYVFYLPHANITVKKKKSKFYFELRGMSEFHEASRELLFLTGTPSVRNLKF